MAPLRDIIDECLKAVVPSNEHREIEVSLKNISETYWRALNKSLRSKLNNYEEIFCGISRQNSVRDTRQKILFLANGDAIVEKKAIKIAPRIINDTLYSMKCSAESQEKLQTEIATILQNSLIYGYRYRISFVVNEYFRIDMSRLIWFKRDTISEFISSLQKISQGQQLLVDPEVISNIDKTEYECEVEFIKFVDTNTMTEQFVKLYPLLQMSDNFVSSRMQENLKLLYTPMMPNNRPFMVEARNLKVSDLTSKAFLAPEHPFTLTLKADGERKLLIFNSDGIWLNYPPYLASLISTQSTSRNFIFDCEVIDKQIFIFDCLVHANIDVRKSPHAERLAKCVDLPVNLPEGFSVKIKKFYPLRSSEEFFRVLNSHNDVLLQFQLLEQFLIKNPKATEEEILQQTPVSEEGFHVDGFMFTPGGEYNTGSFLPDLVKNPMVCKWKPTSLLTIDFHLRLLSNGQKGLFSYNEIISSVEVFTGSKRHPYNQDTLNQDQFANVPLGSIVEMRWSNGQFYLYRTRENKNTANSMRVALDNWKDICEPLSTTTLLGKDFTLVRKYHNRLKQKLLQTSIDRNSIILDIGSGVGGDLPKFALAKHIFLVEPDIENLPELQERIQTYEMQNKVTVINAKFQDTERIREAILKVTSERINLVTSMFSLTFFWESRDTLKQFVHSLTSLAPDARFLFATMEGHAVLASQQAGQWQGAKLTMNTGLEEAVFERQPKVPGKGHAIDVQIPGVTVKETQREYLVFLSDLPLPPQYKLQMYGKATEELLLPEQAKLYSSFYVFGAFGVDKSVETALSEQLEKMRIVTELGKNQDDNVSDLTVSGYENYSFKRIGNISLIGAILKAVNPAYQELQSLDERKKFCSVFQRYAYDNVTKYWENGNLYYFLETTVLAIYRKSDFPPFPSEIRTRLSNSQFSKYEIALFSEILNVNIVILTLNGSIFQYADINPPLCENRLHTCYILQNGDFYDNILIQFNGGVNHFVETTHNLNEIMSLRISNNVRTVAQRDQFIVDWNSLDSNSKIAIKDCALQSDVEHKPFLASVFQKMII